MKVREVAIDHYCSAIGCAFCLELSMLSDMAREHRLIFRFQLPPSPHGDYTGSVYSQNLPLLRRIKAAVWKRR